MMKMKTIMMLLPTATLALGVRTLCFPRKTTEYAPDPSCLPRVKSLSQLTLWGGIATPLASCPAPDEALPLNEFPMSFRERRTSRLMG